MNLSEDNCNHGLSLVFLPFLEGDGAQGRSESSKLIQTLTLRFKTKQDKAVQIRRNGLEENSYIYS